MITSPLRSQSGSSLIQALIAVALVGLSAGTIAHWSRLMSAASGSLNQTQQIEEVMERVNGAFLDDENHCYNILKDIPLAMSNTAGVVVPTLSFKNDTGTDVLTFMTVGSLIPETGLTLQDLRIVPVARINAQTIVARLEYTFSKSESFGGGTIRRFTPIYANLTLGKISNCTTSPIPREIVRQRKCEMEWDGTKHYEPTTNTCENNLGIIQVTAVLDTATCPAGYRPAASAADPRAKEIACVAPGFTLVYPRTYTNNYTNNGDTIHGATELDFTANTCKFYAISGAPATGTGGIMRCMPGAP